MHNYFLIACVIMGLVISERVSGAEEDYEALMKKVFLSSSSSSKDNQESVIEKMKNKNAVARRVKMQKPPVSITGFDQQVDEMEYILGSGDELTVYVWGGTYDEIRSVVDHEGNYLIPMVGFVPIRGLTLKEGKEKIREKVSKIYANAEMSIILSRIREFKCYVLGEVMLPGYYIVNGATRVSDIIDLAGGWKENKETNPEQEIPNLRHVQISNASSPMRYADIKLFYQGNDLSKNPYLLEGDRVFVDKRNEFISIYGAVNFPGEYDYVPGDSLLMLIRIAGGLTREVDSAKIIVSRFVNDLDSLISYEVSFADSSVYNFPILRDDRVLICEKPDYRKHLDVIIAGEVEFPGVYPIREDKTKLVDIIAMAGGLTENAFLKGSKIVRKYYANIGDREFERVKSMPAASLTPMERSYLKTKMVEEDGIVSIDFEDLLNNGSEHYNIILKDKDEITIARKSLSIKVSGAVVSPGLVSYKEGASYKYYLMQTGGFNTRADKRSVMVIKGGTEVMLKPQKVKTLEAGDAVWVPEKEYINGALLTKDIIVILSSVLTVIVSALTVRELMK